MDVGLIAKVGVAFAFSLFLVVAGVMQTYVALIGRTETLGYGRLEVFVEGTRLAQSEAARRITWLVMGPVCFIWGLSLAAVLTYFVLT